MPSAATPGRWPSPPQLAQQIGVDASKIIIWIRAGQLNAINVAANLGGRPRYRVDPQEWAAFLAQRSTAPAPKPVRSKKAAFQRKYFQ
jgi:hypothetical protein